MGITLANFQLKAIEALMEAMGEPNRDIILKSCTGSGKTIILTHFMDEYLKSTNKAVFVWLTPGKGNLELQSKAKMDKYIHGSNTKLLSDIMSSGFEENDACFINWEKLTKKGNNALKDSERTNFVEHMTEHQSLRRNTQRMSIQGIYLLRKRDLCRRSCLSVFAKVVAK